MLLRVEKASLGIATCRLPARNDRNRVDFVEPSVDPSCRSRDGSAGAARLDAFLVEAYLIFGFLSCLLGKGLPDRRMPTVRGRSCWDRLVATFAPTKTPKADNAMMKTRNGLFFPDPRASQ